MKSRRESKFMSKLSVLDTTLRAQRKQLDEMYDDIGLSTPQVPHTTTTHEANHRMMQTAFRKARVRINPRRREIVATEDKMRGMMKTEWVNSVVTCVFIFKDVNPAGKVHTWPKIVMSKSTQLLNGKVIIGTMKISEVIQRIKDELYEKIGVYRHGVATATAIDALSRIFDKTDKHGRTLLENDNGDPWTSMSWTLGNYNAANSIMIVNAQNPLEVCGLRSITGDFGCVVDTLASILDQSSMKTYDQIAGVIGLPKLIDGIPGEDVEVPNDDLPIGVSVDQFIEIVKVLLRNRQWYIHSMFDTIKGDAPNSNNHAVVHFTTINNHVYLGQIDNDIDMENKPRQVVSYEGDMMKKCIENPTPTVYLVKSDSDSILHGLLSIIGSEYKALAKCKMVGSAISAIQYREHVFLNYNDYNERLQTYERMNILYPTDYKYMGEFPNSSWITLVSNEYQSRGIELVKSFDNPHDFYINKQYKSTAFCGPIDEYPEWTKDKPFGPKVDVVDYKKNYPHIAIEHAEAEVPIFEATDSWVTVGPENIDSVLKCEPGFYLVAGFKYMGMSIDTQIWPSYWFYKLWTMEQSPVVNSHILKYRKASKVTTLADVSAYIGHIIETHGDDAKFMYTRFVGMLGITTSPQVKSIVTTDNVTSEQMSRNGYKLEQFSGINLIYKRTDKKLLENHYPYFTMFTCGSIVKLMEMVTVIRRVTDKPIYTGRTDGLYVGKLNADEKAHINAELNHNWKIPSGRTYNGIEITAGDEKNIIKRRSTSCNEMRDPIIKEVVSENKIVTGLPGCGKSRSIEEVLRSNLGEKILLCTYTKKVIKDLEQTVKKSGHSTCKIHAFAKLDRMHAQNKLTHKFDRIIVDELSCLSAHSMKLIYHMQQNNPSCIVMLYGDIRQLPAVGEPIINLDTEAMKWMFPVRERIKYQFEGPNIGRCDKKTCLALLELQKTGKLNADLCNQISPVGHVQNEDFENNIVKTNATRVKISDRIDALNLVQMERPWLCIKNNPHGKYNNGQLLTDDDVERLNIPAGHLQRSSAITTYRVQGATMNGPVVVYDVSKMSLRDIYVAISRCTSIDLLVLVGDSVGLKNKVFYDNVTKPACREAVRLETPHIIYRIVDETRSQFYVGRTYCDSMDQDDIERALNRRLYQHRQHDEYRANHWRDMLDDVDEDIDDSEVSTQLKNLSSDTTIEAIHVFMAEKGSVKLQDCERFWIREYQRLSLDPNFDYFDFKCLNVQGIVKNVVVLAPVTAVYVSPAAVVIVPAAPENILMRLGLPPIKVSGAKFTWALKWTMAKGQPQKTKRFSRVMSENARELIMADVEKWIREKAREQHPDLWYKLNELKSI